MAWNIKVRQLTQLFDVHLPDGKNATVLDLKKGVQSARDGNLHPYLQRLLFQGPDGGKTLQDEMKLSSYAGMCDGCTVNLLVLPPFELYITAANGRMHTLVVPSCEPEDYPVGRLLSLVQEKVQSNFTDYQLQFKNKPLRVTEHGKPLTLRKYRIKKGETLFIKKLGFSFNISNPKVDVCFLVDCTGSMASQIEAVKNNVKQLRDDLVQEYRGCDIRFSFVRYTDYDVQSDRTTWIDFTKDQTAFHSFVSDIIADGGDDSPEDIMGGLQAVFSNLSWRSECCRILLHIADCPCHGTKYHTMDESYPNGDPGGLTHEQMMAKVCSEEVQYWFGYINRSWTDQMIGIFNECLQQLSEQRQMIRQFDAQNLIEFGSSVRRSVTASIDGSEAAKKARVRSFKLDSATQDWNSHSIIEQYGKRTPPPRVYSIDDLPNDFAFDPPSLPITFKCAPNPFAEGTECLVYYGFDLTAKRDIVLKQYKQEGSEYNSLDCYMKELEIHIICSTYCRDFNRHSSKPQSAPRLEFHSVNIVQCPGSCHYLMESLLSGEVEKFSNNAGIVCIKSNLTDMLQAFSHFSWVHSGRSLLICDLQGVDRELRVTLTDPAIHSTAAGSYGHTDLGQAGIKSFFNTHTCSSVCQQMGLSKELP